MKKEEELTRELVALFLNSGQELATAKRAVEKALKQIYPELLTKQLVYLFEGQMKTLKDRGCPENIIKSLQSKKDEVIATALRGKKDHHLAFLPVIPRSMLNTRDLMHMIHYDKKRGESYVDDEVIRDTIKTPAEPYFIFDVDDGSVLINTAVNNIVLRTQQSFLTADEGIALCIHTNVLKKHYINCGASVHRDADLVASIYFLGRRIVLYYKNPTEKNKRWGTPSCRAKRI